MSRTPLTALRHRGVLGLLGLLSLLGLLLLTLPASGRAAARHDEADHTYDRLADSRFWLNPDKPIIQEESLLRDEHRFEDARKIEKIASQPQATWFAGVVTSDYVNYITSQAASEGEVPVYVMYDLPWRGCGQAGAGGAPSPAAYRSNVRSVARGIGSAKIVMIIEPDALSEISCLSHHRQRMYYRLIRYAVHRFSRDRNAALYIDAGHPDWEPATVMARRLMRVTWRVRVGFSLNVSNFYSTTSNVAYGTMISRATHGKHFVIDTSRNGGHVRNGAWCNPSGAKIGAPPTDDTGNPLVDALLWIKPPGTSDGTCNGGPAAGDLWLRAALSES